MTHIEGQTQFRRSPAALFDFLADPRHEPQYNPLVVYAEKLTPGPIGPGTRFRQRIRRFGRTDEIVIDLVDAERPDRLTWRIDSAGLRVHGRQTVTATGDGSSVHWEWDFHLRGVLRLLGPLVGLAGRRLERRVWSDMQRHLDRLELSTGTSAPRG
ncbi:SRPBCC family protein [Kribbella sp. HUAS MG21]|jgi:hypothetical protein|uniref:SRPBCC family protein n=1 Tax=Kribbella sp. HUAS MG21 TaxID=3160966 RepID=A0AAU7T855_9ACTN